MQGIWPSQHLRNKHAAQSPGSSLPEIKDPAASNGVSNLQCCRAAGYLTLAAVAKCLQAATWLVARGNKKSPPSPVIITQRRKTNCPTRYHSDFVKDFTHFTDTDVRSYILPFVTAGSRLHLLSFPYIIGKDFGQPLRGEFQTSSLLPHTSRQLSAIKSECTIPHLRICLFH